MTPDTVTTLLAMLASGLAVALAMWLIPRGGKQAASAAPPESPPAHRDAGEAADGELGFSRLLLQHTSDVLMRIDRDGNRLFVSPSCREVLGYEVHEVLAARALALIHPDDRPAVREILQANDSDGPAPKAIWRAIHRDGHTIWIEASYRRIAEDGGAMVIMRDITQRKQAEERLLDALERMERMALIDSLSGLPNRGAFLDMAEQILTGNADIALLFIDLDRFRPINDLHGHAAGDAVLREIATRLKSELAREPMAARMGADEFGVLLRIPNGDPGVASCARDLIRTISEPMRFGDMTLDVGATIGITVCPRDGTGAIPMLRNAELAIARAKQAGGGTYRFFEPAMGLAQEQAAELKRDLRGAIRDGQIVPWFQPVMRLENMSLAAYEVLARWEHPRRGILEPPAFLPLAEEAGASADLFEALLSQACEIARDWPAEVGLSFNVSPHELHDESLPDDVARILARTGFDGARLEVEITENALIHDSKVARGVLDGLRALGVSVALDDFGTGFSSLYHLRELPFDKVKIDRSLMRGLADDADSERYVGAIIGLGHALGLELTAEGVEDEASLARLRLLGCTYGQGNVFARPMPAAELKLAEGSRAS